MTRQYEFDRLLLKFPGFVQSSPAEREQHEPAAIFGEFVVDLYVVKTPGYVHAFHPCQIVPMAGESCSPGIKVFTPQRQMLRSCGSSLVAMRLDGARAAVGKGFDLVGIDRDDLRFVLVLLCRRVFQV